MTVQVLATICARGGSKGVPGKNTRLLDGKPLIGYTIECARGCVDIGHLVVSTDSDEIALVAEMFGVRVSFRRPAEFAGDTAAKIHAIRHATEFVERTENFHPDIVVDLDIGVPLRTPEDVSACIRVFADRPDADAVVTVYEAERNPYFNMVEIVDGFACLVKTPRSPVVRRQDAPQVYSITPSVFAWRRSAMQITHLFEGRWAVCPVPRERAIDIDTELEFRFVEYLMGKARK